jgi:hypothetical protein
LAHASGRIGEKSISIAHRSLTGAFGSFSKLSFPLPSSPR